MKSIGLLTKGALIVVSQKMRAYSAAFKMKVKAHVWWLGTLFATVVAGSVAWIGGVNATGDTVEQFKVVFPRMEKTLNTISQEQKETNQALGRVNERLSSIEGEQRIIRQRLR